jgi:hypothetical protein
LRITYLPLRITVSTRFYYDRARRRVFGLTATGGKPFAHPAANAEKLGRRTEWLYRFYGLRETSERSFRLCKSGRRNVT